MYVPENLQTSKISSENGWRFVETHLGLEPPPFFFGDPKISGKKVRNNEFPKCLHDCWDPIRQNKRIKAPPKEKLDPLTTTLKGNHASNRTPNRPPSNAIEVQAHALKATNHGSHTGTTWRSCDLSSCDDWNRIYGNDGRTIFIFFSHSYSTWNGIHKKLTSLCFPKYLHAMKAQLFCGHPTQTPVGKQTHDWKKYLRFETWNSPRSTQFTDLKF